MEAGGIVIWNMSPSSLPGGSTAMRLPSEHALIFLPVSGLILLPHSFCGHVAHDSLCLLVDSADGRMPSDDMQSGASGSWPGFHCLM